MANILESISELLQKYSDPEGDPPPPAILLPLGSRLGDLLALSVDPSGDGIDRWLGKLRAITQDTRLRDTLVVRAMQMEFPRVAEALTLLGIIGFEWEDTKPAAFSINWSRLDALLTSPGETFLALLLTRVQKISDVKALQVLTLLLLSGPQALLKLDYRHEGFTALPLEGVPGVSLQELLDLVQSPLALGLPFALPLTLEAFKAQAKNSPLAAAGSIGYLAIEGPDEVEGAPPAPAELHDWGVDLLIKKDAVLKPLDLANGWGLTFATAASNADTHYRFKFSGKQLDPAVTSQGDLTVLLTRQPADSRALLVGAPNGTHFSIRSIQTGLRFHKPPEPLFDWVLRLQRIEFALRPDFLKFLSFGLNLPTLLQFNSDVEVSYVQGKGLTGQGSSQGPPALGVQFATPLNLKIGGSGAHISIDQVVTRLELKPAGDGLRFRALFRYGAAAQFGPLRANLDGAGVWIGRWTDGNGGLLPPQGIGLSLDAGPVSGGGFLKIISENEFAGALQLKVLGIGAFAFGLYKTLPSGDPSFVALIGIRLPLPGIQIGFGFAISGFGGLVGINRRADTDVLRERLASGSSGDVLFNDNPMKNAPRLLGDMQLLFPDEKGIFLIGPTLQLNWLHLFKLDVGFFIELPGPRKLFLAGSARFVLGSEEFALVYLRMDFVGGLDFTRSLLFFDGALVNSHVLGIFRITGGIALRLAYGDNGYFLLSIGGFHPSFQPAGMELPRVARVGVGVSLGPVWLKQEMYLAITSNTFQLGFKTEAGLEIGPISAHGWFAFDALIQFRPFYFVARIDAGFEVEVADVSLCNVRIQGQLSGPGPLVLEARASVRLLFIKVSGHVTIQLSANPPEARVVIGNLPAYLAPELSKADNLRVEGEDQSVLFGPATAGEKLFAPVGELVWEQKRVPLNLAIEKVEGVELGGWHTLVATTHGAWPAKAEEDWFGVGTYLKLGDSEALNNPRFARQQSGLRIGTGAMSKGTTETAIIALTLVKLPKRFLFVDELGKPLLFQTGIHVNAGLGQVLGERSTGPELVPGEARVKVQQEIWNAHDAQGQVRASGLNPVQAFVQARQTGGVALPATEKTVQLTGVF